MSLKCAAHERRMKAAPDPNECEHGTIIHLRAQQAPKQQVCLKPSSRCAHPHTPHSVAAGGAPQAYLPMAGNASCSGPGSKAIRAYDGPQGLSEQERAWGGASDRESC